MKMNLVHRVWLLRLLSLMLCITAELTELELYKLASVPSYQHLELNIDGNPFRLFFAAWHDMDSTAEAFALTVLQATGGKEVVGSGCVGADTLSCLTRLMKSVMHDMLSCCPSYILVQQQHYGKVMTRDEYNQCLSRSHNLNQNVELTLTTRRSQLKSSSEVDDENMGIKDEISVLGILNKADLGYLITLFEKEKITVSELPMLSEEHLRQTLHIPLGPTLRLMHVIKQTLRPKKTPIKVREINELLPDGIENVDWARTPCVPPYCWHRCARLPQGRLPSEQPSEQKTEEEEEEEEDSISWTPEPRKCRRAIKNRVSSVEIDPIMLIHPISVGIAAELVVKCVPHKRRGVAPLKPVNTSRANKRSHSESDEKEVRDKRPGVAYEFTVHEEFEYHRSYQESMFAVTFEKSGWDCLRHYEILAAGCVPYFVGVESAPKGSLGLLPKNMLLEAINLPGVKLGDNKEEGPTSTYNLQIIKSDGADSHTSSIDVFNETKWFLLAQKMLKYTRKYLTTKAIAEYVLKTSGHLKAASILLIGGNSQEDGVRDMLIHGFSSIKNITLTISPTPHHMFEDNLFYNHENGQDDTYHDIGFWSENRPKKDLYGSGFTYSKRIPNQKNNPRASFEHHILGKDRPSTDKSIEDISLDMLEEDSSKSTRIDFNNSIVEKIKRKYFDVVIFGSVHRGMPYLDEVLNTYSKEEVILIDGEDKHGWAGVAELLEMGHFFMREMPDGCPPGYTEVD